MTPKKTKKVSSAKKKQGAKNTANSKLRLMERRKHPRFLLTREQFRETKTGRIFTVYDLSQSGLSIRVEEKYWPVGSTIQGILNLHPDSIELVPRVLGYYGDRAALKIEASSTYARSVLARALSPKRLGASLQLVREKLPLADYWFHGVCNTDVLLQLNTAGDLAKVEVFFSNYYWSWSEHSNAVATGVCQSFGKEMRQDLLLAEEPVKIESVDLSMDGNIDPEKTQWAKGILEAAPLEPRLKQLLLKKFENPAGK
ncbi:MAG: PilZ domain-containing protein [Bdellovibrionota bacterium]